MDSLELAIKKRAEKAKAALSNQVTKDDKYSGVCWCWNPLSEKYVSTEDSYITARLSREPLFKSKESAKKYRSAKTDLFSFISFKVQKDIEESLKRMDEYVPEKFMDDWRKSCWYEKDWF